MTRIASLGMYDHPAQRAANDRLWRAIAARLRSMGIADVPDALDRTRAVHDLWWSPDLLFGQACGYPLTDGDGLPLTVLALPIYAGDTEARHASVLVTRADEDTALAAYRGRRAAINDPASNTGMNLFRAALAPIAGGAPFFSGVVITGAHRESVWAVLLGRADIAAIDAVTWAALDRYEPALTDRLRIIGRTPESPTLPFVTADRTDPTTIVALRTALHETIADPALADARAALFLTGLAEPAPDTFSGLQELRTLAERSGYPILA